MNSPTTNSLPCSARQQALNPNVAPTKLPELPLITRDEVPRIALNTIATLPES